MSEKEILKGILIDENHEFSLSDLSRACGQPADWVITLVEEGVIEPMGEEQSVWRFRGTCLRRVKIVQRLQSDLGINLAGAALALELLEEVELLRAKLEHLQE